MARKKETKGVDRKREHNKQRGWQCMFHIEDPCLALPCLAVCQAAGVFGACLGRSVALLALAGMRLNAWGCIM